MTTPPWCREKVMVYYYYVNVAYCNPGRDGSLYYCLIYSNARVQLVDDKVLFVFVVDANAHH